MVGEGLRARALFLIIAKSALNRGRGECHPSDRGMKAMWTTGLLVVESKRNGDIVLEKEEEGLLFSSLV